MRQIPLPLGKTWGGARPGAGRKPRGARAGVPHVRRPAHKQNWPLHVTARVREGLPSLRTEALFRRVEAQLRAARRRFLRIVHFSVQSNHIHLLIEAADRQSVGRGMKGLAVRVARAINGLLGARGNVWDDRYHARVLRTPREVRHALVYVLFNHRKHGRIGAIDACSSARFFDGWTGAPAAREVRASPIGAVEARSLADDCPVIPGETWLLRSGWKRLGLLKRHERPVAVRKIAERIETS